ncbi:MAG: DUF1365 domain-containing protein [Gammaproteobacteria bacterium]
MKGNWLYHGAVSHVRLRPRHHAFRYPALFICVPLSRLGDLQSRLFSLNRFNLFSLHERDHGKGQSAPAWIRSVLASEGVTEADGETWLMTMPRILGFVFNPVSFWWCHDASGQLRAVLCEVNNTFGERHCYLVMASDRGAIGDMTPLDCRKIFHVSPFLEVKGHYCFRFSNQSARRTVAIDYVDDGQMVLKTVVTGQAMPLDDRHLVKTFLSFGLATVMVVVRINWQALKLWLKGIRFHSKPALPSREISQ